MMISVLHRLPADALHQNPQPWHCPDCLFTAKGRTGFASRPGISTSPSLCGLGEEHCRAHLPDID
jgi:hypothetical protein